MKTTLTDKDLDLLTFASGVLHSNKDTHQLAHGLLDLRNRQRALTDEPVKAERALYRAGPMDADNAQWQAERAAAAQGVRRGC